MSRFYLLISWLIFVLVVSVTPVPETGIEQEGLDKLTHFIMYGITALIFLKTLFLKSPAGLRKAGSLSILFSVLYGILMEIFQFFLSYRSFSVGDIFFNFLGASFSIMAWGFYLKVK